VEATRAEAYGRHWFQVGNRLGWADGFGRDLAQLALAWILRLPGISSALIGASRPEQVSENAKASGITADESLLGRIETVLAE